MATIRHHTRIDRPADDVWKTVSDAGAIATWFPGLDGATFDGTVRTITMGGIEVDETVVTSDDDLRRFQYRITGGPMVPEYHLATIDVLEDSAASLVVYSCEVEPDDGAAILGPILADALGALKTYLEG